MGILNSVRVGKAEGFFFAERDDCTKCSMHLRVPHTGVGRLFFWAAASVTRLRLLYGSFSYLDVNDTIRFAWLGVIGSGLMAMVQDGPNSIKEVVYASVYNVT